MTATWQWLLRLDQLRFGQEGVSFGFERPLPPWAWALVVIGAMVLGWISYRRLDGPRVGRAALAGLRALTLSLIVFMIAGPRLIKPNEVEEPDWVLVLVDRSASLSVRDVAAGVSGERDSREQQLRAALEQSRPVWSELGAERVVVWMGFDAGAYEINSTGGGTGESNAARLAIPELGEPAGRRTDLNRALEQALKRASARPLSGVVILTDGRSVAEPSRAVLRRLEAEKVPVFTVALGSAGGLADLAVRRVEAPKAAFVRDAVPVEVEVERIGSDANTDGAATVELIDNATGSVLDTREVTFDAPDAPTGNAGSEPEGNPAIETHEARQKVTLVTRPTVSGAQNWSVRIRPSNAEGRDAIAQDLIETNNAADASIELVDRPLRVLHLDGYPRWEYRYLKNVLVREGSIASASTILAPDRRYIQEGSEAIDALPASPEEWARFDVLIIGDVLPTVFTPDQLTQIRDRVATAGLGIVWIAGEGAVPDAWRGTPLADLLPFAMGEAGEGGAAAPAVGDWGEPVVMAAAPAAEQLGVLRLSDQQVNGSWWPERLSDPRSGWSQLRWAQRIDPRTLKPTADVLAVGRPALARGNGGATLEAPLVLSMRFGAGRSIYVGTDEIWRWRYGRGEFFTERFWLQIIRLLGRESVARSGKPALLRVLPDRGEIDRPIRVEVTLIDQALVDARPDSLRVRIARAGAPTGEAAVELTLTPEGGAATRQRGGPRTFSTTWIPIEAGAYRVEAIDPLLLSASGGGGRGGLSAAIEIWQPDDELRRPQTDHPLLAQLSKATGGTPLTAAELSQLPRLLPNRRVKLAGEPDVQTLWDTPLALILLAVLLTAEWIGRRLLRLA